MMISITELLIMGPLCILLFYAYCRDKPFRLPLELVVCSIQIFGTIVFTGSEIWEGFPNIPTDFEMTFEKDKVLYFWIFFVAANILWIVLPLRLLLTAFCQIDSLIKKAQPASATKPAVGARRKKAN